MNSKSWQVDQRLAHAVEHAQTEHASGPTGKSMSAARVNFSVKKPAQREPAEYVEQGVGL
jgi:hypothetical protein